MFVNVVNDDMARCSDFELYTLNILSSDYFSALKLYQKFEKDLRDAFGIVFHND